MHASRIPAQLQTTVTAANKNIEKEFKNLFSRYVDENSKLLKCFSCDIQSDSDNTIYHGKVYITEKFLFFYSNTNSFKKVIPFIDIINIVKKNTAFVFANAIGVTHSGGFELFTSMSNRDKTYEYLIKVWGKRKIQKQSSTKNLIIKDQASKPNPSKSIHADDFFSMDDSDSEGEIEKKEKNNETNDKKTLLKPPSSLKNLGKAFSLTPSTNEMQDLRKSLPVISRQRIDEKETSVDDLTPNNQKQEGEMISPKNLLDIKMLRSGNQKKEETELQNKQNNSNKGSETIEIENKKDINHEIKDDVKKEGKIEIKQEKEEIKEEIEIEKPIGQYSDHIIISTAPVLKATFKNITCNQFYTKVMNNSKYWNITYTKQENKNVIIPEFTSSSISPNTLYTRECTFISPIKGAPMGPKETRVIQTHNISRPTSKDIIMETISKSLDIPYADAFLVQTLWEIHEVHNGCELSIKFKVDFLKSVWVKSLIEKNAKSATELALQGWVDATKQYLSKETNNKEIKGQKIKKDKNEHILNNSTNQLEVNNNNDSISIKDDSFLETKIEIPIIGSDIELKIILFILVGFICSFCGVILFFNIRSVESEIILWNKSTNELQERLFFLQLFTSELINNISNGTSNIEQEWIYWKKTKGLDWRLAEWQDQMKLLELKLALASKEVGTVLKSVSNSGNKQHSETLLNENHLKSLLTYPDTTKVLLKPKETSNMYFYILLTFLFLITGIVIVIKIL